MKRIVFSALVSVLASTSVIACGEGEDPVDGDQDAGVGGNHTSAGGSGASASGGTSAGSGGALGAGGSTIGSGGALSTGGGFSGGAAGSGGAGPSAGGSDGSGGNSGEGSGGGDGSGGMPPVPEADLVTSGPDAYWQIQTLNTTDGAAAITVNDSSELGEWQGFGGTFNEKGWAALANLSPEDRARAIRLLFDKSEGCGFSHGRIPIGSSDYALTRYSLAEQAGDFEMEQFSIAHDRDNLIPYIQAALDISPNLHFWASPWSPPPWMKDNNAFDRGNMKTDAATLDAHALYLTRFVEEYENEGIYIESIQPQNEPGYLQDYPSCGWSANLMTTYIRDHLGPLFAERLPEREIWLGTISNPSSKSIVDTVMSNSGAAAFVSGIGVQWSQDQYVPGYLSSYQVPVMQTEHRCGNFPNQQQSNIDRAPNDQAYAEESWGYISHYIRQGVSSYMAWNMVLDPAGRNLDMVRPWAQNALLVVEGSTLIETPTYYVFRHVAQYVDPGAVRVDVQGGDAVAWKNPDDDIVVVFHNDQNSEAQINVAVGGSTYQVPVPGRGWATLNWQAP